MNLPNKLTLLRILLIPVMVVIYYITKLQEILVFNDLSLASLLICIIFIVASLTDMLDGQIARKYNMVTTFGKFADPLADKILVFSALILLQAQGVVPAWVIVVIMAREFIVSGIRLVAVEQGVVIAASNMGKLKTISTMLAIILLFNASIHNYVEISGMVMLYVATFLTIISGIDYFWKNRGPILKSI